LLGERAVIALFTFLGALLALIGGLIAWMADTGMVHGGVYVIYSLIALGIVLILIGVHLLIAGIASLRRH
jgi:hypothetical protein